MSRTSLVLFLVLLSGAKAFSEGLCTLEFAPSERDYSVLQNGVLYKTVDTLDEAIKARDHLVADKQCQLPEPLPTCEAEKAFGTFHNQTPSGTNNLPKMGTYKIKIEGKIFAKIMYLKDVFKAQDYLEKSRVCRKAKIQCSVGASGKGFGIFGASLITSPSFATKEEALRLQATLVEKGFCESTAGDVQDYPPTSITHANQFWKLSEVVDRPGQCNFAIEGDFSLEALDIELSCKTGADLVKDEKFKTAVFELGGPWKVDHALPVKKFFTTARQSPQTPASRSN